MGQEYGRRAQVMREPAERTGVEEGRDQGNSRSWREKRGIQSVAIRSSERVQRPPDIAVGHHPSSPEAARTASASREWGSKGKGRRVAAQGGVKVEWEVGRGSVWRMNEWYTLDTVEASVWRGSVGILHTKSYSGGGVLSRVSRVLAVACTQWSANGKGGLGADCRLFGDGVPVPAHIRKRGRRERGHGAAGKESVGRTSWLAGLHLKAIPAAKRELESGHG
ncbi:hypothetical protein B0H14DRAFT_2590515 [Mycena olivaceomarginata]|nr:hypothetical protein B0H14DRAFT_2590515 [Mycena olivaceomarginata]